MQLYLVQHGAAKSETEDPQRSLTAEGTKTVEGMAQYLSQVTLHVDRIEHSDKQRARQTAEIMAAHLQAQGKSLAWLRTMTSSPCANDCNVSRKA